MESSNITEKSSNLISLIKKNAMPSISSVPTTPVITTTDDAYSIDNNYILMPLFSGLFVAVLLLWMLYRYTVTTEHRSHQDGTIYCCPQRFFDFISVCFRCKKTTVEIIKPDLPSQNVFRYVDSEMNALNSKRTSNENTSNSSNLVQSQTLVTDLEKVPYHAVRHNSSFRIPDNLKSETLNSFYHSFKLRDTTIFQ